MTQNPEYLEEKTDIKVQMDEENSDLQNKASFPRYTRPKQIYKPVGKRQISNKKMGKGYEQAIHGRNKLPIKM